MKAKLPCHIELSFLLPRPPSLASHVFPTEALAYRGGVRAGGVHVGGGYRRRLIAEPTCTAAWVGIGAAAVGAAVIAPRYYNSAVCGYYPNPPCY